MSTLRKRLRELLKQRWDGLRAVARAERWQMESWCSRQLLRKRLAREHVSLSAVLDPASGDTIEHPERVLSVTRDFYARLYGREETSPHLCPLDPPNEPPNIAGGPIHPDELLAALKSANTGRSPGPDGLPVEFYVKFWGLLAVPFAAMVNRAMSRGGLPRSLSKGLIVLLCKDEARRTDLREWRPITLLNADYKLVAKCLASRLTPALDEVVGSYQTCCVLGRSAQLHGLALRDLLTWAEQRQLPGMVCSFDQEKAFDRVAHAFLFETLERAGLGTDFVNMVRALGKRASVGGHQD